MKKTTGERIQEYRLIRGYTQDDMADKLGIKRASFSSYEHNRNIPPSNILAKIADILKVSADYLLGRTENPYGDNYDLEGRTQEELLLYNKFMKSTEEMLRSKDGLNEEKMKQVMKFMEFIFLQDIEEEKKGRNSN
ncbi:helix-turn-helix domain-containing protein [Paenibacillus sp. FJAT-26967]|uniref:helix-turn-helix domain-containing protein n=1 Tax=Paenibacillus sp. FJAT-26967 TaxID=1729690 RepID=UPI00083853C4|nr:helix-turn-helix transcriptional regulator [Paenibacillus sp. FJAT-26967]